MSWVKGKPKGTRTPVIERVMAQVVEVESGCWEWRGGTNGIGYGTIGKGGRVGGRVYCHRVTYESFIGEIPSGLVLDHLCRNPICCNPWHVEPVTQRVNLLRGETLTATNVAKTACPQGHPYAGANLYVRPVDGSRHCRTCAKEYQRNLRARRKVSA